jgi:hypothetical protein
MKVNNNAILVDLDRNSDLQGYKYIIICLYIKSHKQGFQRVSFFLKSSKQQTKLWI